MKNYWSILVLILISASVVSGLNDNNLIDDFQDYSLGDNASVWEKVYSYGDSYSIGGAEVIEDGSQVLEVSRAYLWHKTFSRIFLAKMKVSELSNDYLWYGSRLSFVNPEHSEERYEVRLYPNSERVFVKYVNGNPDEYYSETLAKVECEIKENKWYRVLIMKTGKWKWKAMIFGFNTPTCIVGWSDKRIDVDRPAVGIQSAGKDVVSRFDEILAF